MREDVLMRLISWQTVLSKALGYIGIGNYLCKQNPSEVATVEAAGRSHKTFFALEAEQGLHLAAVVLFRQVFSNGRGSPASGIANNYDDEIERIRERMEQHTVTALALPQADYDSLMANVASQRNELLAHYDGDKADFRRPIPEITAMKIAGSVRLMPDDVEILAKVILTMHNFVQNEICTRK